MKHDKHITRHCSNKCRELEHNYKDFLSKQFMFTITVKKKKKLNKKTLQISRTKFILKVFFFVMFELVLSLLV